MTTSPPENPPHAAPVRVRLETVDSTSLEARRRIDAEQTPTGRPLLIRATVQTAGRGRQERAWSSPPGGLWMTLACPEPAFAPPALGALGLRVGLALTEAVAETAPSLAPRLKWPNDVMIEGRKVAGALTEILTRRGRRWILIGCGVNADLDPDDLPGDLRRAATTLREHDPRPRHADRLAEILERRLLEELERPRPAPRLARDAERVLHGLGESMSVRTPSGERRDAVLIGLEPDGRAVFELPSGERFAPPGAVEIVADAAP